MTKRIVIFGVSEFAALVHYYFTHDAAYQITAFTVDSPYLTDERFCNLPVIPFETIETEFPPENYGMFIAVGYSRMNQLRSEKFMAGKRKGYSLVSYISTRNSTWPDLRIGENCLILENNVIQPFVTIEDDVFIWSGNLISHQVHIGRNCFISSHVSIGGHVDLGENCFIGMNSIIKEKITVARNSLVGAGSIILKSTQESGVYLPSSTSLSPFPLEKVQVLL